MVRYPEGKGIYIWQLSACSAGDPIRLAEEAVRQGFSWVAIKAQNGIGSYNAYPVDRITPAVAALRAKGIKVWLWGYLYGADPNGTSQAVMEANKTAEVMTRHSAEGFIADPEVEYKRPGARLWADQYLDRLADLVPGLCLGLSSYRYPDLHLEFPWREWLAGCDFHAPQVYWVFAHNPAYQLEKSVGQLLALKDLPVVPVGAAYSEGGWSGPTVAEIDAFDEKAHAMGCPGAFWWSFQHAERHPDWWQAIGRHEWGSPAPPAPPDMPAPVPVEIRYPAGSIHLTTTEV